ncbi:MAG: DUF1772 domain-containing protein [Arenicella sp.]|nr:DUF1772 domain-containing protein [Arenicella sp.]
MIEQFYILTTLVIGLFAGSLLTEAIILVPYWRRMEPVEFFRLHGSLGPSLFRYYAPLTSAAVILAVTAAALAGASNVPWLISAGLCLITIAIFVIYFRAANNRFATHDISSDKLGRELQNWSNWHWLRTSLVIVALGTSIYGHTLRAGI